jgi:hypothetical protein
MDKLSEGISKSVLFKEFTKNTTFWTYHVIEAKMRYNDQLTQTILIPIDKKN